MKTFFQEIAAQLPETFYIKPVKKLPPQNYTNWSPRAKTALAALTTFSTLSASYLTYRYLSPKINIPDSSISSPIGTAFNFVGFLAGLAGAAGLLAYSSTAINSEKKMDLISSKNTKPQPNLNKKAKKTSDMTKRSSTHSNIEKLFNGFNSEEKN
jgi:hypothetical protein